jgi:hypothetical protein
MHVARSLTIVRRETVELGTPALSGQPPLVAVPFSTPHWKEAIPARLKKHVPGAILLMLLALFGGLFPLLF